MKRISGLRSHLTAACALSALLAICALQGCSSSDPAESAGESGGSAPSAAANNVSGAAATAGAGAAAIAGAGGAGAPGGAAGATTSGGAGGTIGTGGASGGGAGGTSGGAGTPAAPGGGGGGGGSASTAGSGGAGGSPAYDPCPTDGSACKLMPLGDPITDGCCGENTTSMGGSYRVELFRLSLTHNKKLTFVGSHQSGPNTVDNVTFPKSQEGHSGWTIADGGGRSGLQTPIAGWLEATPPHIVTLMIGTNESTFSSI